MMLKLKNMNFHQYKRPIFINNIDINKLPFRRQDSKYFIGYKDDKELYLYAHSVQKMSKYRRDFEKTKCLYFIIKDNIFFINKKKFGLSKNHLKVKKSQNKRMLPLYL